MTVTQTTFVPTGKYNFYAGTGAVPQAQNVPRGDINFDIINEAVTVGGSGNEQKINVTCNLPTGFTYVFAEMSAYLTGTGADNWDTDANTYIIDQSGDATWIAPNDFSSTAGFFHTTVTNFGRAYTLRGPTLTKLIVPLTAQGQLFMSLFNTTQDDAAGIFSFHARFHMYDVLQSFFSPLNTPILTR